MLPLMSSQFVFTLIVQLLPGATGWRSPLEQGRPHCSGESGIQILWIISHSIELFVVQWLLAFIEIFWYSLVLFDFSGITEII